jgi:hypothetical protein
MAFETDEGPMGYFRNFVVVATTPEAALDYVRAFEPEGARGTLAMDACEDDGADADHLEGVYGTGWVQRAVMIDQHTLSPHIRVADLGSALRGADDRDPSGRLQRGKCRGANLENAIECA